MSGIDDLVDRVASLIAPGAPVECGRGQNAISRDLDLLQELLEDETERHEIRLWTNSQCLVVTRAISRRDGFAEAEACSADRGWPVYVRSSGGSTVAHRPGILNISMFRAGPGEQPGIEEAYEELTDCIGGALSCLGIKAVSHSVPNSFCDGRFNICANGRKIAGTASYLRKSNHGFAHLAHASLSVEGALKQDIDAISRFERSVGLRPDYRPEVHATLEMLLFEAPPAVAPG